MTDPLADVSDTIQAKSDQLNADDLMGGPALVRITKVERGPSKEQPIKLHITGGWRPWLPSKTDRRVLVSLWGKDARAWVGRWMDIWRDPTVRFKGKVTGGVRIQGLSDIRGTQTVTIRTSQSSWDEVQIKEVKPPQDDAPPKAVTLGDAMSMLELPLEDVDIWLKSRKMPPVPQLGDAEAGKLAAWIAEDVERARGVILDVVAVDREEG